MSEILSSSSVEQSQDIIKVFKLENLPADEQEAIRNYFENQKELKKTAIEWAATSQRAQLLAEVLKTTINVAGNNNAQKIIDHIVEWLTHDTQEMLNHIEAKIKTLAPDVAAKYQEGLNQLKQIATTDIARARAEASKFLANTEFNAAVLAAQSHQAKVETPPKAQQSASQTPVQPIVQAHPTSQTETNPAPTPQGTAVQSPGPIAQGQGAAAVPQGTPSSTPSAQGTDIDQQAGQPVQSGSSDQQTGQPAQPNPAPGEQPRELTVEEQVNLFKQDPAKFIEYQINELTKEGGVFWGLLVGILGKDTIAKIITQVSKFFTEKVGKTLDGAKNEGDKQDTTNPEITSVLPPTSVVEQLFSEETKAEIAKQRDAKLASLPPDLQPLGEIFATLDIVLLENKGQILAEKLNESGNKFIKDFFNIDATKMGQISQGLTYMTHEALMQLLSNPHELEKILNQQYKELSIDPSDNSETTKNQKDAVLKLFSYQAAGLKAPVGLASPEDVKNAKGNLDISLRELGPQDPTKGKIEKALKLGNRT